MTVNKDGLILVFLFLLCVAVSYIVNEFVNKKAERTRKQKGQIFKTLMRTAQTKSELKRVIFDENFIGTITPEELEAEFNSALNRIENKSRKEEIN